MRKQLFKRLLAYLRKHPSRLFERVQLQLLLFVTAKAFEKKGRWILFSRDAKSSYAEYTKECMKAPLSRKNQKQIERVARTFGRRIRKITGFTDEKDLRQLVFFLYRNIGISLTGRIPGRVLFTECFFSQMYSAEECRCMSAMDRGMIAGICGCGDLQFTKRITEGCEYCAAFVPEGKENI